MAHRLLWNPMEFIDERKKNMFKHDGYWFAIGNSLIFGVTMAFLTLMYTNFMLNATMWKNLAITFLVGTALSIVSHFFSAYLLYELLLFMNKKLDYFKSLAVIGYTAFTLIASLVFTTIFYSIPIAKIFAPFVGILLVLRSYGIFLRFLKEYVNVDIVEGYIISLIVLGSAVVWFSVMYSVVITFIP